jgi:uncharacterized protein (TIGR00369 family)
MAAVFEARNPAFAERVRGSLLEQPLMSALLGAVATRIEPGYVDIDLAVRPDFLQPHGNAHGVILSALADSATGYAAQTLMTATMDVVTVEYKINYLAPAFGERIVARGQVVRPGRTLYVCAADVFAVVENKEKLVAHMVATMMAVPVDHA